MQKKKPLLLEFLQYIAKPSLNVEVKPSKKEIIFNVVRLWGLVFVVSLFFAALSNIFLTASGYSQQDFALVDIVREFPYFLTFLLVVIWAPISEEIAFRLWLRFTPFNWALGLSFLALFFVAFLNLPFIPKELFTFNSWLGFLSSFSLVVFVFFSVYLFLKRGDCYKVMGKFFKKNFRFFFYTGAILFAILHITNYDVDLLSIWYYAPILIFPQLFLSFMISFARMRYGFSWAVLIHSINNAIIIIPILFLLPILDTENFSVELLSMSEIFVVLVISSFFIILFLVCILSILSLLLEFTKKD